MGRQDGKTEQATPRRKKQARREGRVAKSQEVAVALSLLGAVLALHTFTPHALDVLAAETRVLLGTAGGEHVHGASLRSSVLRMSAALVGPFLVVATVAALVAGVAQVGFTLAPKAAKPKLSNLNPKRGLQRLKPSTAAWELLRTGTKLGLLTAAVWGPMQLASDRMAGGRSLDAGLTALGAQTSSLLVRAALLAALVAAADYAWNRHRTGRELRMTRQEVKREAKDSEGDPHVRGQRRRRQSELSRNRMLRDVADADVLVTNPTRLAVALRYRDDEPAPRVLAKGSGKLAARMRAIAYRHGVHVLQDKPLARALYRRCRPGQYVPSALYEAVAVVLAVAYRRHGSAAA